MLVKHTIDEEVLTIKYTFDAECNCDRCHKSFQVESEEFEIGDEDEAEDKFLKNDFSLCPNCRLIIDQIKKKQMSFIRKGVNYDNM